jgi:hypothetical protein
MTERLAGIPAPKTPANQPGVDPGRNVPIQPPRPPRKGPATPATPASNPPIKKR